MTLEMCPKCGDEMKDTYLPQQKECFNCGLLQGSGIRTGALETTGQYEADWMAFPDRFRAVIFRVMPLWMADIESERIDFEFAAEIPGLRLKDQGYKYRLVSIYAEAGFPWPTDFGHQGRKDARANTIPTHLSQLRIAIAGAIALSLDVEQGEIRDLHAVIRSATMSMKSKKRRGSKGANTKREP